jgi:hypothetical protein
MLSPRYYQPYIEAEHTDNKVSYVFPSASKSCDMAEYPVVFP